MRSLKTGLNEKKNSMKTLLNDHAQLKKLKKNNLETILNELFSLDDKEIEIEMVQYAEKLRVEISVKLYINFSKVYIYLKSKNLLF